MKGNYYASRHWAKNPPTVERASGGGYRIPVKDLEVTVTATGAAVGFGSAVLAALPQGNLVFKGAVAYLRFQTEDTDLTATFNGDYSIGTTADANGALATTEIDIIASTAIGPAVARVTPAARGLTANASGVLTNNVTIFDNTDGSLELNLNVLIDAADITDDTGATLTVDGVIYLDLSVLGDD